MLRDFTGEKGETMALDVGCAVGGAVFELAQAFDNVLGIDYSHAFVDAAKVMTYPGGPSGYTRLFPCLFLSMCLFVSLRSWPPVGVVNALPDLHFGTCTGYEGARQPRLHGGCGGRDHEAVLRLSAGRY